MKKNPVTAVNDFLYKIEKEVTWILFFLMLLLLVAQVLCRYVLKMPLAWSEELVRLAYIAVSFSGASIAVRENTHISINILPSIINIFTKGDESKTKKVLFVTDTLMYIVCFLFWVWITYQVFKYTGEVKGGTMLTSALQFPQWYVYISVCVFSLLLTIHYLLNLIEHFILKGEKPTTVVEGQLAASGEEGLE